MMSGSGNHDNHQKDDKSDLGPINTSSLFQEVYHAGNYLAVSAYYQQRGYAINNKFKSNLLLIAKEKIDACWESIDELLSHILLECGSEFFLKPLKDEKRSPKNLFQLINTVNRDGYYILLSQTSLTIFLRNEIHDTLRNGKDALRNLCRELLDLFASEIMLTTEHKLFLSNVEDFHVKQVTSHSFINFYGITQSLIKNNVTILLSNLEKLPKGEDPMIHEHLVSLVNFKDLFLLKILDILNYGNMNQRTDFDETLKSSDFYEDCRDDFNQTDIKMEIMRKIYQVTGQQTNRSDHLNEIVHFENPADLISSLGLNNSLNPFDWQLENFTDLDAGYSLFTTSDILKMNAIQVTETQELGNISGSEWEEKSAIDEEAVRQLEMFFKEVCLSLFDSCFHDTCLILTTDCEKKIVIDFNQLNHYQLRIDNHSALKTLTFLRSETAAAGAATTGAAATGPATGRLITTKSFLEMLLEISDEQTMKTFLKTGCVVWRVIGPMIDQIAQSTGKKFLVIENGLERCKRETERDSLLEAEAQEADVDELVSEDSSSSFLVTGSQFEVFPKTEEWLKGDPILSCDDPPVLLISIHSGKMRAIEFSSLRIHDNSSPAGISPYFVIH
jgi:hypothetical protein